MSFYDETVVLLEAAPTSSLDSLGLVLGIVFFIALMAASYFLLRWFSTRSFTLSGGKYMKVLDRLALSRDSYLVILQIGGRLLTVIINKDSSSLLCELSPDELIQLDRRTAAGVPEQQKITKKSKNSFAYRLIHNMKLNMGLLPKGSLPMTPTENNETPSVNTVVKDERKINVHIPDKKRSRSKLDSVSPIISDKDSEELSDSGREKIDSRVDSSFPRIGPDTDSDSVEQQHEEFSGGSNHPPNNKPEAKEISVGKQEPPKSVVETSGKDKGLYGSNDLKENSRKKTEEEQSLFTPPIKGFSEDILPIGSYEENQMPWNYSELAERMRQADIMGGARRNTVPAGVKRKNNPNNNSNNNTKTAKQNNEQDFEKVLNKAYQALSAEETDIPQQVPDIIPKKNEVKPVEEKKNEDRLDAMFDRVSKRKGRYAKGKDQGKEKQ